ncbi:PREDICTED: uncharacterized protein LOC18605121 [Theobroma cacao]|uniref:Uncharacterized protein LOC18605121 n=1 Tax=Theobroma cacao TaxID=3641 RepID=A0AB32VEX6_THECC|nr:PREDICTED: uncharacterized protein LOC18605121 [Theobroma cacao]
MKRSEIRKDPTQDNRSRWNHNTSSGESSHVRSLVSRHPRSIQCEGNPSRFVCILCPISFTLPSLFSSFLFPKPFSHSRCTLLFLLFLIFILSGKNQKPQGRGQMADWGPVLVATVLFVLLSPGLLFQIPGRNKVVEFGNMQTSGASILVHAIIYFGLITVFCIAIGVHIYASQ